MKKKVILLAAVLTLGVTVNAFAGAATWITPNADGSSTIPGPTTGSLTIKPSANVKIGWGVTGIGVSYSMGTYHSTGTMTYATSSGDTNIYRWINTDQAAAKVPPDSPLDANSGASWPAGWTASK